MSGTSGSRAPEAIEYGPGTTRYGFLPGDRVQWRSRAGGEMRTGVVAAEHAHRREVRVYGCGVWDVKAECLTLISPDVEESPVRVFDRWLDRGPLAAIGAASHANAKAKGFYDELEFARAYLGSAQCHDEDRVLALIENLWLLARCSLVHSEVSEMVEAIRDGALTGRTVNGKPEGLPSEMADVTIRLADLAHSLGIDLDRAVTEKAAYNATRPNGHGRTSKL